MKKMLLCLCAAMLLCLCVCAGWAEVKSPYVYNFPKPAAEWGQAAAFGNLSPGFFQIMYQNSKTGIVRIATYGIIGGSMDTLKDPQLMMVFAFDHKSTADKVEEKWMSSAH
jgi:hypothetical protein